MTLIAREELNAGLDLRILVVRPDRLGDVVLSTPVFEMIKRHYPKAHVTVLVRESMVPILKGLDSIDQFMIYEPEKRHAGIKGFFRLYQEIRSFHFRFAIVLQSHWKIAFAIFLAQVRYRVGPLSKLHSFLLYNRGVRQRRSQVEMHEADYNLQLLRKMGVRVGSRHVATRIHISQDIRHAALQWLVGKGWSPSKKTVLVHPGMGGSALNWPESHYHDLVQGLLRAERQVIVTGGHLETELLERMKRALGGENEKVIFYFASPSSSVDFLAGLYSHVDVVVAPSTGPLHVAVALGKPVVTFYPPIRVQSALRWGPYLADESRASILVPEVYCGQDFECLGSLCNYFPCMKSLSVKRAIEEINRHLVSAEPK